MKCCVSKFVPYYQLVDVDDLDTELGLHFSSMLPKLENLVGDREGVFTKKNFFRELPVGPGLQLEYQFDEIIN